MSLLNVEHLTHGFGDRAIFDDVSFRLLKGEHIGLVGANGEGKSTFMNIITGKLMPDKNSWGILLIKYFCNIAFNCIFLDLCNATRKNTTTNNRSLIPIGTLFQIYNAKFVENVNITNANIILNITVNM